MNFIDLVNEFLNHKVNKQSRSVEGYDKDLLIFRDFLLTKDISSNNLIISLQGVNTDFIIESLRYYIINHSIETVSTAQRYVAVVKEFLSYIFSSGLAKNDAFLASLALPGYHQKSFRFLVNTEISNNTTLNHPKSSVPFSYLEIISLIEECDKALLNADPSKDFNLITSSLIYKLIAYTGMAYREIIKIQIDHYNDKLGILNVNSIPIHIPHKFANQINTYLSIRKKIAKTNRFFIRATGGELLEKTSSYVYWLNIFTGRLDLTGIIKFAIIEMIRNAVNPSLIMRFTGVKQSIMEDCISIVLNDHEKKISKVLRSMDIFEEL